MFLILNHVWMLLSRTYINRLHEKTLRLSYKNNASLSFEDLIKKDKTVNTNINNRNLYGKN